MKIPPPIIFVLCLGLAWSLEKFMPIWQFTLGYVFPIIVALVAICFLAIAVLSFKKFKTTVNPLMPSNTTSLVTTGVYSITRNPMYLGMALLLLASSLYLGALSAFIAPIAFVIYITNFQIKPEEKALSKLFGENWTKYEEKTRRWI